MSLPCRFSLPYWALLSLLTSSSVFICLHLSISRAYYAWFRITVENISNEVGLVKSV
jgi:hypothetical protein